MQYLIVRIEETTEGRLKVEMDNCSREDAKDIEKAFADILEQTLMAVSKSAMTNVEGGGPIPESRYKAPSHG